MCSLNLWFRSLLLRLINSFWVRRSWHVESDLNSRSLWVSSDQVRTGMTTAQNHCNDLNPDPGATPPVLTQPKKEILFKSKFAQAAR